MSADDPKDRDAEDLDRAAILARRQRFIALALSGLATTGACTPTDPPRRDGVVGRSCPHPNTTPLENTAIEHHFRMPHASVPRLRSK